MKQLSAIFLFAFFMSLAGTMTAQKTADSTLVQFSGVVLDGSDQYLYPIPYTNVYVQGKNRGTYSDFQGFFSIVVEKGDVIEFSAVGYKPIEFTIPDTMANQRYSVVQLMTKDTINLPETVIFPWPSREHFKLEFLAMDVSSEMQERAMINLAKENLEKMRYEVASDGNEHADYYLRQQAAKNYYIGQVPPMNIFNPLAWAKFFKAWKEGKFKRKKNR